jgi:hypothetical protein
MQMKYKCSTELQGNIVAIIRDDMAEEAAAGFPLLNMFPNSETAGVPTFFQSIHKSDQEALLDGLAYYSVLPFSHELVKEKDADPLLHKFLNKQPDYGPSYLVGRPRQSALKKLLIERLTRSGFECKKKGTYIYCRGFVGTTEATLKINLDPGLMRQLDYGLCDWMKEDLVKKLKSLSNGQSGRTHDAPIIDNFSFDHMWTGTKVSSCTSCWDLISESNVEQSIELLSPILLRLAALIDRINALDKA